VPTALALVVFAPACGASLDAQPAKAHFVPGVAKKRAVIWAVGDGADGSNRAKRVARMIDRHRVDRFLYLGDVYEYGTAQEFATHYDPVYGRLKSITAPTIGNHEWGERSSGYNPYWRRVWGTTPPEWYAFSAAGWQILSLNSEAPHTAGSPQLDWLRAHLAATRRFGNCRIAFWHRPRFSAGAHGNQPDVAPLWHALAGHARIVLNGHDHDMQRLRRTDGITEMVSGAGGHDLYDVNEHQKVVRFSNDRRYGALRLRLRRGHARYAFMGKRGATLDRGSLHCRRG
jgi:hypothetical protein